MTLDDFERALDTFGVDFTAWPPGTRQAGEALLQSQESAQRMLESYQQFDALFASFDIPQAPPTDAIVHFATMSPRAAEITLWQQFLYWSGLDVGWMKPAALGACVVIGVVIGALDHTTTRVHEDDLYLVDGSISSLTDGIMSENMDE